jgi:hypothetical protein
MSEENTSSPELADIWGDTVKLKHLGGAMVIGVVLGFAFYWSGLQVVKAQYPNIQPGLLQAVGLLVGIVGCLLAAVISAKLYPPKRTLSEQEFSPENRAQVLQELQVDMVQEAEDMKTMSPAILAEMKELQLDVVFQAPGADKKTGA